MRATKQSTADLRQQGDELADQAFLWLKNNPDSYQSLLRLTSNKQLADFQNMDNPLSFLIEAVRIHAQVDLETIQKGSQFFEKHAINIFPVLGLYSLPYCYAGARGVRVLYTSQKIKSEPIKRLIETAEFVFDCCRVNGFSNEGKALISIIKVRLMHAAARYYTSRTIKDEIPVNQEDMVGTWLSFSLLVVRGLKKMGLEVSAHEFQSYMYLWTVIGNSMGIREEYIPQNARQASVTERMIRKKEFRSSAEGQQLTRILIDCMKQQEEIPEKPDPEMLMSYFLGPEVSAILGLRYAKVSQAAIGVGLTLQRYLQQFNGVNFKSQLRQFEQTKMKAGIQPNFDFSFD